MFSFLVPIVSEVYGAGIGIFDLLIIIVTYTVAKHVAHVETSNSTLFIKTLLLAVRRQLFKMQAKIYSLSLLFVYKHIFIIHNKYSLLT